MTHFSSTDKIPLILITDDDRITRRLIRQAMEKEGYRVIEANDGQECLDIYKRQLPDIVLLDAMMPIMDGFTCCQELTYLCHQHSEERFSQQEQEEDTLISETNNLLASISRTPILMITGLDNRESVDYAFAAGASDYITKPINWAVLRQRVRRLIQQSRLYQQLEIANSQLQRLATIDGLTQLANRRRFEEYIRQEWRLCMREKHPLSLILCDIDYFKPYNDNYGHQAGDSCLQQVAAAISIETKRPADLVARYGGEELVVVLPDTDALGAMIVAQRIRSNIKKLQIEHKASSVSHYITLSLGVASMIPQLNTLPSDLIEAADQALYEAKKQGRDRAVVHKMSH